MRTPPTARPTTTPSASEAWPTGRVAECRFGLMVPPRDRTAEPMDCASPMLGQLTQVHTVAVGGHVVIRRQQGRLQRGGRTPGHQARCLVPKAAAVSRSSDGASRLLLRVSRSLRWKRGWRDFARRRHREGAPVRSDHQAVPSHQDHQDHGKPDGADGNPCAHGDHPFGRTCPTLAGTVPLCVDIRHHHREPDKVGPFGWGNRPARLPEGSLRQQSGGLPGTSHRSVTRLPERGGLRPPPHRSPTTG